MEPAFMGNLTQETSAAATEADNKMVHSELAELSGSQTATVGTPIQLDITASEEESKDLPSIGSAAHATGQCTACHFEGTARGCSMGYSCRFCHLHDNSEVRLRPSKAKRVKAKQLAKTLAALPTQVWLPDWEGPKGSQQHYLFRVVNARLKEQHIVDMSAPLDTELPETRLAQLTE
jgi:hypothetical protein